MTKNQLEYHKLQEERRHNREVERETNRTNVAKETETHRSNTTDEQERARNNDLDFQASNISAAANFWGKIGSSAISAVTSLLG